MGASSLTMASHHLLRVVATHPHVSPASSLNSFAREFSRLLLVTPRLRTPSVQAQVAGPSHLHARSFTSSYSPRAALAQHLPSRPTVLVAYPSESSVHESEEVDEDDEVEYDLIPPQEAKLEITDRAAEQLRSIAKRENNSDAALRIAVESGGCHGYQYKMELAKSRHPDDYHFTHPTLQPSNILVDAVSMSLLNGSTIDFATELIGSSFRVVDNPQAKGSSCGCGVSWELKI